LYACGLLRKALWLLLPSVTRRPQRDWLSGGESCDRRNSGILPTCASAFVRRIRLRVSSGNPVVVFNVCGNTYRLICAIHYDTGKVFLLRFLTHAEYDKDRWKDEL